MNKKSAIPRVNISTSVLRWAMDRSGKVSALEQKFPKLYEWIAGESMPTFRQLESLAKATYTPFGYFFLPEPPAEQLPIPYFRTLDHNHTDQLSPDLLDTVRNMKQRQVWMREYLIERGNSTLPFVGSARLEDDPKHVALEIRTTLGLKDGWAASWSSWTDALRQLQISVEDAGIIMVVNGVVGNNTHRKLDPTEFRGFVLIDDYAPLIFVNGADGKAAQMFTLAHELAHVWFGVSAAFDLHQLQPADDKIERICNVVAAEFLVPEKELEEIWQTVANIEERFQVLARHFKVSELVISRRALDLEYITKTEFIEFYMKYLAEEHRPAKQSQGGNFYANQNMRVGKRFAEHVVRAVREERLLYREAYQLTGLYGTTFDRYVESLELGGLL